MDDAKAIAFQPFNAPAFSSR